MALIAQETIDQIAAATDIVDVVGSYFPLKRAGTVFKATCPFHQERTPSFTVNPQRQIFKCFGCGAGGSAFRFVMDYEHVDFATAVRRLAERAGITIAQETLTESDHARLDMRRRLLALHAETADWFHLQLMKTAGAQSAREYLKMRGISATTAKAWKIGFAPEGWDIFSNWARSRGYSIAEIEQSGLVSVREADSQDGSPHRSYDRFRNRVMFPICNDIGEVIAFSGRTLESNPKAGKYVNSPETMLFTKGAVLFGLHRSKRPLIDKQSAIVCEGQIDLITAFEAGIQNVTAPQGTAFTDKQARILKRYVEEVILCFDSDAAGEKAAERSLVSLLAENLTVRVATMPPGEDPDSLIRTQGAEAFMERIKQARDFFEFQLDRLASAPDFSSPRGRVAAARKVAAWIGLIQDPALRSAVANKSATRLEMAPAEFVRLIPKQARTGESSELPPEATKGAALLKDPTLRELATAILHDAEARKWLGDAPWRELLSREADSTLLVTILENGPDPEDVASVRSFLTTLDPDSEAAVTELLEQKKPAHPLTVANDCWNSLIRRQLRRHMDALSARLRTAGLPLEETLRLHREIQECQKSLSQVALPTSPPMR